MEAQKTNEPVDNSKIYQSTPQSEPAPKSADTNSTIELMEVEEVEEVEVMKNVEVVENVEEPCTQRQPVPCAKQVKAKVLTGHCRSLQASLQKVRRRCKMGQRKIASLRRRLVEAKEFAECSKYEKMLKTMTKEQRLLIKLQFDQSSKAPQV